jgi:hypothetical protein
MDSTPIQSSGTTFDVCDVEASTNALPSAPFRDVIVDLVSTRGKVESHSRQTTSLVSMPDYIPEELRKLGRETVHSFISAMNLAYDKHYPITMSPDIVWLLIAQAVSAHVLNASEELRQTVAHAGKLLIEVRRDEFVRGFEGNDWEGMISEFSATIRAHIGDRLYGTVVQNFSTTGIAERAAFEITLLEAMQNYFEYRAVSLCGIPSVNLEGTTEDWKRIRDGIRSLEEIGLGWWLEYLNPVLNQFVDASRGDVDLNFWQSFYKFDNMSGGPYITGHVVNFFPYLISLHGSRTTPSTLARNPFIGQNSTRFHDGMTTDRLPTGISIAPFVWEYHHTKLDMEFLSGFVGFSQDPRTLSLRPEIGWAVIEKSVDPIEPDELHFY